MKKVYNYCLKDTGSLSNYKLSIYTDVRNTRNTLLFIFNLIIMYCKQVVQGIYQLDSLIAKTNIERLKIWRIAFINCKFEIVEKMTPIYLLMGSRHQELLRVSETIVAYFKNGAGSVSW